MSKPGFNGNTRYSTEQDSKIRAAYMRGIRIADVAQELSLTRSQIINRARRLGLSDPRSARR